MDNTCHARACIVNELLRILAPRRQLTGKRTMPELCRMEVRAQAVDAKVLVCMVRAMMSAVSNGMSPLDASVEAAVGCSHGRMAQRQPVRCDDRSAPGEQRYDDDDARCREPSALKQRLYYIMLGLLPMVPATQ